jgi:hypothetical protein
MLEVIVVPLDMWVRRICGRLILSGRSQGFDRFRVSFSSDVLVLLGNGNRKSTFATPNIVSHSAVRQLAAIAGQRGPTNAVEGGHGGAGVSV